MKFPKDNEIIFFQDHAWYQGIPSGVDFKTEIKKDGTVYLTAPGYGKKGDYGNGGLILRFGNFEGLLRSLEKEMGDIAYKAIEADIKSKILKALNY